MSKLEGHSRDLWALITDPTRVTVTVTEAAEILGISRTTAFYAAANGGEILPGVPVLRIVTGSNRERRVVSVAHLRAVLGIDTADDK